jgi:hypothetical protein
MRGLSLLLAISILLLVATLLSCSKSAQAHQLRIFSFAVDSSGNLIEPQNTVMYYNCTRTVYMSDTMYGENHGLSFAVPDVKAGDLLRLVTFVNFGETPQKKNFRVYLDNRVLLDVSNVLNLDTVVHVWPTDS